VYTRILMTDGWFLAAGHVPRHPRNLKKMEANFRTKMIAMLSTKRYSGCNVFCGNGISENEDAVMDILARYITWRSFFGSGCRSWIRREGSFINLGEAGQPRVSRLWNGRRPSDGKSRIRAG
jgi:hypothetical protein